MKQLNLISVIIPAYCEAESLLELVERIKNSLELHFARTTYEIIIVDDGSTDNTEMVLVELSRKYNFLKAIVFRKNLGKSLALMAGLKAVNGEIIITMDADLQDRPEEIHLLINPIKNEGVDLVSGWRKNRNASLVRRVGSKLYNFVVKKVTGLEMHDFNSGFKAYSRDLAKTLIIYGQYHRFIPVIANFMGYKLSEVQISNDCRKHGESKFRTFRYQGLFDLISVVFLYRFALNPLYFFGVISFVIIIPSLAIIFYLTVNHLFSLVSNNIGQILIARPLFIGALFMFMTGITIFLTGLICSLFLHYNIRNNVDTILSNVSIKQNANSKT